MRVRPWCFDGSSSGTEGARCAASAGSWRLRCFVSVAAAAAGGGGGGCEVDGFGLLLGSVVSLPHPSPSPSEVEDSPYETRMVEWVRFIHLTDGVMKVGVRAGGATDDEHALDSDLAHEPSQLERLRPHLRHSPGMSDLALSTSFLRSTERNGLGATSGESLRQRYGMLSPVSKSRTQGQQS